jgi:hypothetical protein
MDAQNHGMNLRFSFTPYPLVGRPREVLQTFVEGNDPVSGKPLMSQIIDALTRLVLWRGRRSSAGRPTERRRV